MFVYLYFAVAFIFCFIQNQHDEITDLLLASCVIVVAIWHLIGLLIYSGTPDTDAKVQWSRSLHIFVILKITMDVISLSPSVVAGNFGVNE